jgi:hypothetical protein
VERSWVASPEVRGFLQWRRPALRKGVLGLAKILPSSSARGRYEAPKIMKPMGVIRCLRKSLRNPILSSDRQASENASQIANSGRHQMSLSRPVIVAGAFLVIGLGAAMAQSTVAHVTSILQLRAGPGTHYAARKTIPSGAEIDVHSCGHEWCLVTWAGREGYVSHGYLMHHVSEEIPAIVHVTNVHYHSIF